MALKERLVLRFGEPLSVTMTVKALVLGRAFAAGVQVKLPVLGLIFAPFGVLPRLKVNVCAGKSVSLAILVTLKVWPGSTYCIGMTARLGRVFTEVTVMETI